MQLMQAGRLLPSMISTAAIAVLALAATMTPAQAGAADPATISCTGTQSANFAPPLGPELQDTVVSVRERLGTFANGDHQCAGSVTGASAEATFSERTSCLIPAPSRAVVENQLKYHWSNGGSSTITFSATTVSHAGGQTIVTAVGTVTDGLHEGAPASKQIVLPSIDAEECRRSGVEHQEGPMTLTLG